MPITDDEERCANESARKFVDAFAANVKAGNAEFLSADGKALFELACRYREARDIADNHRPFAMLSGQEAAELEQRRREFVEAYTAFGRK
jgi:hypothetical protein